MIALRFKRAQGRSNKAIWNDIMVVVDNEYHCHRLPCLKRFANYENEDGTLLFRATYKDEPSITLGFKVACLLARLLACLLVCLLVWLLVSSLE